MGKAPADQWYFKDWLSDTELQLAKSSSRGIWMNALCYMWQAKEKGKLVGTIEELSNLLRATNGDFQVFLEDIQRHKFGDLERQENVRGDEILTLINRRMFRYEKDKKLHRERQVRYEQRKMTQPNDYKNDAKMTSPSPSPSPIAKKESIKRKKVLTDEEWKEEMLKLYPWIVWSALENDIDAWLLLNPLRKKTRRLFFTFITNRMKDKPMPIKKQGPEAPTSSGVPAWIKDAAKDGWKV